MNVREESISWKKLANHVQSGIGRHLLPSLISREFEYEDCRLNKSLVTVIASIDDVRVDIIREMKRHGKCSKVFGRAQQSMMDE